MEVKLMSQALASKLDAIKEKGGVKSRDVAQLLGTTPQTISRWQTGKTEPQGDQLRKLLALEWLLGQLAELYTSDEAKLWLFSPHRLLKGESPAARIQSKGMDGIDDVLALINQIKEGAFV
jgi:transcriptional regulator with XRE-family HTH domain